MNELKSRFIDCCVKTRIIPYKQENLEYSIEFTIKLYWYFYNLTFIVQDGKFIWQPGENIEHTQTQSYDIVDIIKYIKHI